MPVIGLVAEGTNDFIVIERLLVAELQAKGIEDVSVRYLQPEQDSTGTFSGGGWSRVLAWCKRHAGDGIDTFFEPLFAGAPACDAIVIHLDGDAVHDAAKVSDPRVIPDPLSVKDRIRIISELLAEWLSLNVDRRSKVSFAVPVLHTECWLIAGAGVANSEQKDAKAIFRAPYRKSRHVSLAMFYQSAASAICADLGGLRTRCHSYAAFRSEVHKLFN